MAMVQHTVLTFCLLCCVFTQSFIEAKNDTGSDVFISEEIGKNGKRYFIQYRRLGDTNTYLNVRRKALLSSKNSRKYSHEDDSDEEFETPPDKIRQKEVSFALILAKVALRFF